MDSKEIREGFLEFFESKGHLRLKGSSLVPQDPTLLFTVAGMVPLKGYFLGEEAPPSARITSVQKCLRTNDIENVGVTKRHHTFFEMLGNFSIGDYFKEDAIRWALEFSTEFLRLPVAKLWVTIFKDDAEARDIWKKVGIPEERIVPLGEEDNFWTMGSMGPCGPCSEIYFDRGIKIPEEENELPGGNGERFLEFWNLVFTQFDRQSDGSLLPLPRKNIDTGMGLERITSIIEDSDTDFETDLFLPIIRDIEKLSTVYYHSDYSKDRYFKAIADHVRAIAFLISDGIVPSNEKRGYVLRRLIRRAELFGRNIGLNQPFLNNLAVSFADNFKDIYSELSLAKEDIKRVVIDEEKRFGSTLNSGFDFFKDILESPMNKGSREISAESVFYLYDTLGFPLELSMMLIEEHGLLFDRVKFDKLLESQREKARRSIGVKDSFNERAVLANLKQEIGTSEFVGYNDLSCKAKIIAILKNGELVNESSSGEKVEIILDKTPFYPEKGGQMSDTGQIIGDSFEFSVFDTRTPIEGLIVHSGTVLKGTIKVGDECIAQVDVLRRSAIKRAHTSTHILQAVLRDVFGSDIHQQGSEVKPDEFRFDFNFTETISQNVLFTIEKKMNEILLESRSVSVKEMDLNEAKGSGALAFFEEKYGDKVRVVEVEGVSKELCGGTHISNTSQIGSVAITSFRTVASGVKRIEALSGEKAYNYFSKERESLGKIADELNVNEESITNKIKELLLEEKELQRRTREILLKLAEIKIESMSPVTLIGGVPLYSLELEEIGLDEMRKVFDIAKKHFDKGAVLLSSLMNGKTFSLVGRIDGNVSAIELFKKFSERFGFKGGGNDRIAQGSSDKRVPLETILKVIDG